MHDHNLFIGFAKAGGYPKGQRRVERGSDAAFPENILIKIKVKAVLQKGGLVIGPSLSMGVYREGRPAGVKVLLIAGKNVRSLQNS